MKIIYIVAAICFIAYFTIIGITGAKLASKVIQDNKQSNKVISEVLKESGIYNIIDSY